uniref:Uncharacterized protein n=1 Tax=Moniliophthora roreri TaxID=221103 RepID=A0A0W0G0J9_MONRR
MVLYGLLTSLLEFSLYGFVQFIDQFSRFVWLFCALLASLMNFVDQST